MQSLKRNEEEVLSGIKWVEKKIYIENIVESADNLRLSITPKEIERLADDIKENGLFIPLIVHKVSKNAYEIIDGHRRYRAIKEIGTKMIPCRVSEHPLNRSQLQSVMIATDRLKIQWSKYDLARKSAILLRENGGSITIAAAKMLMSPPQFKFYATVGELSGRLLDKIVSCGIPYTFIHLVAVFFATKTLCNRVSMTKEEVTEALMEKWINSKVKSTDDFRECIKKVYLLKNDDLKHWITSDLGFDVLKVMTEGLPERKEKLVESVNKSLGQTIRKIRDNDYTYDDLKQIQDQLSLLTREVQRKTKNARHKVRKLGETIL